MKTCWATTLALGALLGALASAASAMPAPTDRHPGVKAGGDGVGGIEKGGSAPSPSGPQNGGVGTNTSTTPLPGTGTPTQIHAEASDWTDLGGGLAQGDGQPPLLSGEGFGAPGAAVGVRLEGAPASSRVVLVLGTEIVATPLAGGVLVPAPQILVTDLVTDGEGTLVLFGRLPETLPTGVEMIVQAWVPAASASGEVSASNALALAVP